MSVPTMLILTADGSNGLENVQCLIHPFRLPRLCCSLEQSPVKSWQEAHRLVVNTGRDVCTVMKFSIVMMVDW